MRHSLNERTLAAILEPLCKDISNHSFFTTSACTRQQTDIKKDILNFTVHLRPTFDEKADINLYQIDGKSQIKFVIKDNERKKPQDTIYFKTILLSQNQIVKFDSDVIQMTKIKQPHQWQGCCDGMPVSFVIIHNNDTPDFILKPDIRSTPWF